MLWAKSTVIAAAKRSSVKLLSRLTAYSESRTAPPTARAASLGRPHRPRGRREPLRLQKVRDQESHLDRLLGIEARIAEGVIAVVEVGFQNDARAAGAFGDVLADHFEVDAAGVHALGAA